METKVNFVAVGAFVLVLGAALVAGVLWIASGGRSHRTVDLFLAVEEESVSGLNINAPVKYSGVDVGTVHDIQLDPENPERVRLLFAIRRGTPIRVDTVAVLKTQGLTGIAYVELDGGSPGAPLLKASGAGEYPVIRTKPSLSARLENVLTDVLVKLDGTTTRIDAMLSDENQQSLSATLRDIAAVSHTLAARKDSLDAGLLSAANTFGETERLGVQLGPVIERIGRAADSLEAMGRAAGSTSTQVGTTVAAVGLDLQRIGAQTVPQVEGLVSELKALTQSLRQLVQRAERTPSSLLLGQSPVAEGPGETTRSRAAP